tara:strand:- start:7 stop:201 length:195 start_codon:yes stop_codon:yes gene_type:complete
MTTRHEFSSYVNGDRRADVIKLNGLWGCVFYAEGKEIKQELYKGHNEMWAENAAENYVLGIKKI